jgi:hypothetical protein
MKHRLNTNGWPFEDPNNVAVFSLRQIIFEGQPILHVTHDNEDGSWQFLGAEIPEENDAVVVALEEIVKHDPSVKELADLPLGWEARRRNKNENWQRFRKKL